MKISFCTTCKNRLFHLKQTLPINIINSSGYFNKEFVILDYNSEDGLYSWAKKHLSYWEEAGVVKYIRTRIPRYFSAAHAKNICHKNATGDILCNLDCDNFILNGFCEYLVEVFSDPKSFFYSTSKDIFDNDGCCGKISVRKEHFYSVNGYDETESACLGWGWDDVNFRIRVKEHNNLNGVCGDMRFNAVVSHNNHIRTKDFPQKDIIKTRLASVKNIEDFIEKGDFVANKNKAWGFIEDLKIGLN